MKYFILFIFLLVPEIRTSSSLNFTLIRPDDLMIRYMGRFDFRNPLQPSFGWPGSSIEFMFEGTSCTLLLENFSENKDGYGMPHLSYYNVWLDGRLLAPLEVMNGKIIYPIVSGLGDKAHHLRLFKRTEAHTGVTAFRGVRLDRGKRLLPLPRRKQRKIEFIGDSITCGYGNEGDNKRCKFSGKTENNERAYGAITAKNLHAEYVAVAFSGIGMYQNYDRNKERTMPTMYDRIYPQNDSVFWDFSYWKPQLVVINLGTNDFAHENPPRWRYVDTYKKFVRKVKSNYPHSKVLLLLSPMVSDAYPKPRRVRSTLASCLQQVIKELNQEGIWNLHYFELSELDAQNEKDFGCDFHPSASKHLQHSDELTLFTKKLMNWE
ncbi:SGNH/GDSL hydrolase family protein [Flammeovirgaceae bacterium SG7u.111]|nr:SGNH/GDSL hydrolase family protein [Flammeovirgaceae bacterium SG7u.132]WPO33328.1 SGNH/GDSL hydrolase family protein [Flammeovirgaceae bacterium SG7u.111]